MWVKVLAPQGHGFVRVTGVGRGVGETGSHCKLPTYVSTLQAGWWIPWYGPRSDHAVSLFQWAWIPCQGSEVWWV